MIVDPQPVAAHIHTLRAAGVQLVVIARAAHVSVATVSAIVNGHHRINDATAAAILAVEPHPVDATGTRRRLQALAWLGWTHAGIAGCGDLHPRTVFRLINGQPTVQPRVAQAVRAAYSVLWDKQPPDGHGTRLARRTARERGFLPPLAWDDDSIDDPTATPYDPTTPEKPLTIAAAAAELLDLGISVTEIPGRLGKTTIHQVIYAIRDAELRETLRARALACGAIEPPAVLSRRRTAAA